MMIDVVFGRSFVGLASAQRPVTFLILYGVNVPDECANLTGPSPISLEYRSELEDEVGGGFKWNTWWASKNRTKYHDEKVRRIREFQEFMDCVFPVSVENGEFE